MPAKKKTNKLDKTVKSLTPTIPDTIFLNCSFFLFSGTSLPSKQEASKACERKERKLEELTEKHVKILLERKIIFHTPLNLPAKWV